MRFKPGLVCSVDRFNILKQNDNEVTHVIILRKTKNYIFHHKDNVWECIDITDQSPNPKPLYIMERYLSEANLLVVRNPWNIPDFNEFDIDAIKYAIDFIKDYYKCNGLKEFYENHTSVDTIKLGRLSAIIDKIKYFEDIKEV